MYSHIQPLDYLFQGGADHLSDNHPLKRQAIHVLDALESVTNGMENPDVFDKLREIPADSPFSPWVRLVRALESFYRDDTDGMREELLQIPRQAPPRVLEPALLQLSGLESRKTEFSKTENELLEGIRNRDALLEETIEQINLSLRDGREEIFSDSAALLVKELYVRQPELSRRLYLWALSTLRDGEMDEGILFAYGRLIYGEGEAARLRDLHQRGGPSAAAALPRLKREYSAPIQLELFDTRDSAGTPQAGDGNPAKNHAVLSPLESLDELREILKPRPRYLGPGIWLRAVRELSVAAAEGDPDANCQSTASLR